MTIAREGTREILLAAGAATLLSILLAQLYLPLVVLPAAAFLFVLFFFRDPRRETTIPPDQFCSPADGTITEISRLDFHDQVGGPAIRIGMFLSLFNVHINRMPCAGTVREITHQPGEFLDARHPESGSRNESNTLVLDPDPPLAGPIVVRQVAGLVARRIICHARVGDTVQAGERFGLIKFGSRTELIIPAQEATDVAVSIGSKVRAGKTVLAVQAAPQPLAAVASQG